MQLAVDPQHLDSLGVFALLVPKTKVLLGVAALEETFGPHGTTTAPGCVALGTCAAAGHRREGASVMSPFVREVTPTPEQLVALGLDRFLLVEDHWTHPSLALCPWPLRFPPLLEQVPSVSLTTAHQLVAQTPEAPLNLQALLTHPQSLSRLLVPVKP